MSYVDLPWPHKLLWPNGSRGSIRAKAGETRKHKDWAIVAAKSAKLVAPDGRIPILLEFFPKSKGPAPDKDNCAASAKAYLDGIAIAMGVDDRLFDPQIAVRADRNSTVRIWVGETV